MAPQILVCLLFVAVVSVVVDCKSEGDALIAWKTNLIDPNGILQSWEPTVVDPCSWFHITCNPQNSVVRVDIGNKGLSGTLVPELGLLQNLQFLNLSDNMLEGTVHRTNLRGFTVTKIIEDPRVW